MKFSSKVLKCGLSPMRKFHPYAVAAEAKGRKIYHLNIGQPDIETPKAFFDAVRNFDQPVLAYAPSPGIPELIEAIRELLCRAGHALRRRGYPYHQRRQRGAADRHELHPRRRRRDPHPRALLPQLQHHGLYLRRGDPPHSHLPGGGLPLRRPRAASRRRSTSTPAPSWSPTPATPPAPC